jgi:PAS domain S-box-containing protein
MAGTTDGGRDRSYQALRESEELHRATLSSISDAVFMADDHGAFTYICPNVDMIFGYVPDEVQAMGRIGSLLGDNLFDHAELTARGEIRNVEREVTAKSGERRTVLIHFKRVAIQNGTVLCTCRDVTELKQAEKELAAARLELAHAARLALVGELTASIFHEIQQPLAAIHINASAGKRLTRNPAAQPDLSEVASIFGDIHAESGHATEIIERIRALVRKRPLEMRSLDVNDAARDVLRLVAAEAQRRRVILRAELSEVLPAVVADRVSLQQVILNLIVNAIDAIGPESPARHVLVRTREDGNIVEVTVSDTGQGIAQRDLPKLFDPFFTTKKEGVGLGLAIARSIIEAHKGRIWAENNDGPGATFHMSLPVPPAISN